MIELKPVLIDKAKELPVLYESDAKDSITNYLKNAGIKTGENLSESASLDERAEKERGGTSCLRLLYACCLPLIFPSSSRTLRSTRSLVARTIRPPKN